MTDQQENRTTEPEEELAPKDDAKMSILAAAEAAHDSRPGSGTVLNEEEPDPRQAPLDINTAAVDQLTNLRGIGPVLARAIVDYRENVRPFREPSDIMAVPGIAQKTYDNIADRILVQPVEEDRPLAVGYDEPPPSRAALGDLDVELLDPKSGLGQPRKENYMDDQVFTGVPDEEQENEVEPETELAEEPVLVVDAESELEEEPVPDTGAVLIEDTHDAGERDVPEAEPPIFLDADRGDGPEFEGWEAPPPPPVEGDTAPEIDLLDEMSLEEGAPDLGPEPVLESAPPEIEPEPVVTRSAPPPPPPTRPAAVTAVRDRGGVGWAGVLVTGLLAAVAGAALALIVLFALNGTLFFPRNRDRAQDQEISRLAAELSRVETQLGTVDRRVGDVEGLTTRVDGVEAGVATLDDGLDALQGDVSGVLDEVDTVRGNLDAVATRTAGLDEAVGALSEEVTGLDEQVGVLQEVAQRFDLFLAGLRDLLDRAEGLPGEQDLLPTITPLAEPPTTDTPAPTSTATPTLTPTAQPTATPRADVTVIPLATPTP